jgi:hypothetical protein
LSVDFRDGIDLEAQHWPPGYLPRAP